MTTMNISLPETLKAFIDAQVAMRGYASASEYLRELIRHEQERLRFRDLLLEGAGTDGGEIADEAFFDALRAENRSAGAA